MTRVHHSSKDLSSFSSLIELLQYRAANNSDQIAYIFLPDGETEKVSLTYGELDRKARATAAYLQSLGAEGERALLLYPHSLEYIIALWGCLYANVIAIPLYPPHQRRKNISTIKAIIKDSDAQFIVTTGRILSLSKPIFDELSELKTLQIFTIDTIPEDISKDWQKPRVTNNDLAYLQYTSGSTDTPKGVMVSHANVLHNLASMHRAYNLASDNVFVSWLPFFHDMGLAFGVFLPLYGGFPDVLMPPTIFAQRPFRWLNAISNFKATGSCAPNFAFDFCVRRISPEQRTSLDLSSWTLAINGAEPVRPETLERFVEAFGTCGFKWSTFFPSYGLAESTVHASGGQNNVLPKIITVSKAALERHRVIEVSTMEEGSQRLIDSGQPLPDQKTIIVDPELLVKCAPDQIGEIWVSGPSISQGYWHRPEETKQTFHAYLSDTGEGPFLRTGDFGFIRDGKLFITGRLKDLIIIRGRNLYPYDIELTVEKCHPALRPECGAAFSVDIDDEERLVVVYEVEYGQQIDIDEVVGTVRRAVFEDYEVQVYDVVLIKPGSFPKTSSGKVQRGACREAFLAKNLSIYGADRR